MDSRIAVMPHDRPCDQGGLYAASLGKCGNRGFILGPCFRSFGAGRNQIAALKKRMQQRCRLREKTKAATSFAIIGKDREKLGYADAKSEKSFRLIYVGYVQTCSTKFCARQQRL
jgi:hypothetical protein